LGQSCRTCEHPERSAIDIELARGINCGVVGRRFNLSIASVQRHKRGGHIPPSIIAAFPRHRADLSAQALAQLRADESAGVLLHLAQQRSTLLRLQDEAEQAGDRAGAVQIGRELHRNIELTGRTLGTFAEHERAITQVANLSVLMSPEYVDLRANLIKALTPFPEARKAVGSVLAVVDGSAPHYPGRDAVPRKVRVIDGQQSEQRPAPGA
jgi:hypothetical protein